METTGDNKTENQKNGGTDLHSTSNSVSNKQTKLNIPAVVVRNENNDIIEQMDEPSIDFSQTIRRNLKSKLIQRANSPVKEHKDKLQDTMSENSESGSEEGLSDSSDTEREGPSELGKKGGKNVNVDQTSKEEQTGMVTELAKEKGESVTTVKEGEDLQVSMVTDPGKKEEESVGRVREDGKVEAATETVLKDEGGEKVNKAVDSEKEQADIMAETATEVSKNIDTIKKGEGLKTTTVMKQRIMRGEKIHTSKDNSEEENSVVSVKCGEPVVEKDSDAGEGKKAELSDLTGKDSRKPTVEERLEIVANEKTHESEEEKTVSEVECEKGKEISSEQECLEKDILNQSTNAKKTAVEEDDNVQNDCAEENDKSNKDKNSNEDKKKSSDDVRFTEIVPKECGKELTEKASTNTVPEDEADSSLDEKDFSQFNLTKTTTVVCSPPPPLMIPALGVAVNPASIPAVGQFPRGAVDLNTVAIQQFQQFNLQPTVSSSSAPLAQVLISPAVATAYSPGVAQNRFPTPNHSINIVHRSQVQPSGHHLITGLPVGIVPFVPSSNVRTMIHPQVSGGLQPRIMAQNIPVLPSSTQTPTTVQTTQRTFPSSTAVTHQVSPNHTSSISLVPVISTSSLMQAGTITMQQLVNSPIAAPRLVSTSTIAPHVILATQAQVRQTGSPTITSKQPPQTSIPPPQQSKPDAAPVQQKADASTYVDNDSIDISLVNKVKMFYFQCDKCTFVTKSAQNFRRHYMLHLSYKPYACTNCGFSSCNKYGFSSHLKNHQACVGQKFVYKKDIEAERQLERNVNSCKHYKWVSDEENDKSSKELFGDQRRFRFTSKKSDTGNSALESRISGESIDESPSDVQLGVVKKTYSGKKKIRDILGEMESNSRKQTEHLSQLNNVEDSPKSVSKNEKASNSGERVQVAESNDHVLMLNSGSSVGAVPAKDTSQEEETDSDDMSDVIDPLPSMKIIPKTSGSKGPEYKKPGRRGRKKQNGTMKTSNYLRKNFQKAKKILRNTKMLKRRRKRVNKVQNYEIVDESNILDLPRVRKFKTTFDPSPDLYKRRKREALEEEEFQKPPKLPVPSKPEAKESPLYYKCPYCGQSGDSAVGIKRHAFWVHNMCEYTCNLCMYMSMSKQECLRHCYADHPGTSPCIKRSFCKTMEVEEVTDNRDEGEKDGEEEKEMDKERDEHEDSKSGNEEKESSEESRPKVRYPIKGQQNVRCIQCDMKLTHKGMQMHLLRMHKVFMYKCSYCKFVRRNIGEVTDHCTSEHGFKICKAVRVAYDLQKGHDLIEFLPKKKLKETKKSKYSRMLTFKKNFKLKRRPLSMKANCPLCGFASNYIGVQRHLSMRHKLKKLQCGRCGHVTYNKSDALRHSRNVHKEETPYVLRTFADIESVAAMSKEDLNKCGVVMFKQKEDQSSDTEDEEANKDLDAKNDAKVPKAATPLEKETGNVSCPVCFSEKRTLRGVELHMMHLHKICNWLCGRCGFQSTDKYVTLQHSVDLHKDEDPMISRTLVNLDKYLAEKNMDLDYRLATTKHLDAKTDPYKPDFDEDEAVEDIYNQKDQEEMSHDLNVDPESRNSRKAFKRRSCSPKGPDIGSVASAASEKVTIKKSVREFPRTSGGDSVDSDSTEDGFVVKKKRSKKISQIARSSPSLGYTPSSFVVRPKDMNRLNQGFSCVYCNYAAPLRHQVRLHCYDKHTNHPACVMEFQVNGEENFYRDDGTDDVLSDASDNSDGEAKKIQNEAVLKSTVSETGKKSTTSCCDSDSLKEDDKMGLQMKRSESITSRDTDTDELHASEIIDSGGKRFRRGRKRKNRFNNPLKTLVHKLNSSQINLEDTFHGSLDEVDSFLNKFGVRTLNMDMLTQQQFSDFIERFGSCLQPV